MPNSATQAQEELWSLRQRSGLNQTDFGQALGGYTQESISRFEQGRQPVPQSVLTLARLLFGPTPDVSQSSSR